MCREALGKPLATSLPGARHLRSDQITLPTLGDSVARSEGYLVEAFSFMSRLMLRFPFPLRRGPWYRSPLAYRVSALTGAAPAAFSLAGRPVTLDAVLEDLNEAVFEGVDRRGTIDPTHAAV